MAHENLIFILEWSCSDYVTQWLVLYQAPSLLDLFSIIFTKQRILHPSRGRTYCAFTFIFLIETKD